VGKITEKTVCRSVFLTTWRFILRAELTKVHSFRPFFDDFDCNTRCSNNSKRKVYFKAFEGIPFWAEYSENPFQTSFIHGNCL